ncbi:MAG: TetR/AcrR family transcriptional regulator [Bacteroidota bacterium]
MEKGTKKRILDVAIRCFNERGYSNVSLQDLARELSISRGNLAYHFPAKEGLLNTIFTQLKDKLEHERSISRNLPSFTNLRQEIERYRAYQEEYAFIFTDSRVMAIPEIRAALREMSSATIADNKAAIGFAIQVGNMRPEPFPGVYHQLAFTTWMLIFFWLPQKLLRGEVTAETAEKAVWSMIIPHFTDKGIAVFKKYFGENFLEDLGPAFHINPDDVMLF